MSAFDSFRTTLSKYGLSLIRDSATTLQINLGYLCNQQCRHCHLNAGPKRKELMSRSTADQIIEFAQNCDFERIDITGGAPELNPNLSHLITELAPLAVVSLRTNLTCMAEADHLSLLDVCRQNKVVLMASFPSLDKAEMEYQRGPGVFDKSIAFLHLLNEHGYGVRDSGLELNLVSNPTDDSLPGIQAVTEMRFRQAMRGSLKIEFNNLFTFANAPIGRFRDWLFESGFYANYMARLVAGFNPSTVAGLMCRELVSVSWDGYLYDCDFNLALDIPLCGKRTHVTEIKRPPQPGNRIATGDHCYACTAAAGFT